MTLEELLKELQELVDKYTDDEQPTEEDAERMSELTAKIAELRSAEKASSETRAAAIEYARAAINAGTAHKVEDVPLARSASAMGSVRDVTDYTKHERSAWAKQMAERSGVQLLGGTELTDCERMAIQGMQQRADYTHLTSNTDAVVPVEIQNEIITLVDNTAVLFGDVSRSTFPHQFEIARHKSIKAGDAAKTTEGAAPTTEQNEFDTVALSGEEIKKTVKMSRKMAIQSVDGFVSYIESEVAARLAVAANAFTHERLTDATLGMASTNIITAATSGTLSKADLAKMLGLLKTYGNPAAKGAIIYANATTIWNYIAMVEDKNGRSYFVDEKSEDPAVQGRIFGKLVKDDESMADGVIRAGFPDLFKGNLFDGPAVYPYVENGTRKSCFDGYMLYDGALAVPQAFAQLTIGASK